VEKTADFYRKLNLSVSGEVIRSLWKAYRESVTQFVMDMFIEGGTTIVIGAGNMNDLDFESVSSASESIVLADIDVESTMKNSPAGANVREIDFGCFNDVTRITETHDMLEFLRNAKPGVKSDLEGKKFNNILISPFYTQLVLPWVFSAFADKPLDSTIVDAALDLAARTIRSANEYIRNMTVDGSRIYLWTDMLEYVSNDLAFTDISANISDNEWMDSFFSRYLEEFGHGLGSYGHMEMEETLENPVHRWLIWPFDSNRRLIVKLTSGILQE